LLLEKVRFEIQTLWLSLGLTALTIGGKLYLLSDSRRRLGYGIKKEDCMFWPDFIVAGAVGCATLILTATKDHPATKLQIAGALGAVVFAFIVPRLVEWFAYDSQGDIPNWYVVVGANALGYLALLLALLLGANVHG
jgi:RsiW-degrading membrane proteinase PrsW (M82 family)